MMMMMMTMMLDAFATGNQHLITTHPYLPSYPCVGRQRCGDPGLAPPRTCAVHRFPGATGSESFSVRRSAMVGSGNSAAADGISDQRGRKVYATDARSRTASEGEQSQRNDVRAHDKSVMAGNGHCTRVSTAVPMYALALRDGTDGRIVAHVVQSRSTRRRARAAPGAPVRPPGYSSPFVPSHHLDGLAACAWSRGFWLARKASCSLKLGGRKMSGLPERAIRTSRTVAYASLDYAMSHWCVVNLSLPSCHRGHP